MEHRAFEVLTPVLPWEIDHRTNKEPMRIILRRKMEEGKIGYILAWALGIPIPILLLIFLIRGCN
jgi:hypothetical protein